MLYAVMRYNTFSRKKVTYRLEIMQKASKTHKNRH